MGTPSFSRSASVRSGRTSTSISFSRNADSYRPKPRLRSQVPTSTVASTQRNQIIIRAQRLVKRGAVRRKRGSSEGITALAPTPVLPWATPVGALSAQRGSSPCRQLGLLNTSCFPANLLRRLVLAEADVNCVAKHPVGCPGQIGNLSDKLRL